MIGKINLTKKFSANKNAGFARKKLLLILATIILIGAVYFVVINRLNAAELKNRDNQRIKDLEQFIKSLENYYELYGVYPCGDANDTNNSTNPKGTYDSSGVCGELNADVYGFLNGLGYPASITASNCSGYTGGLFSIGVINTNCPMDPINDARSKTPHLYLYNVNADRQLYVLSTYLESSDSIMANDQGLCPGWYEVGPGLGSINSDNLTPLGRGCNP